MLAERVELKMHLPAVRAGDGLAVQVDGHDCVGAFLGVGHQLVDDLFWQRNREDAVLEAIVIEYIGKARCYDAADAEIEKRPGRVLAARPATEIVPTDKD